MVNPRTFAYTNDNRSFTENQQPVGVVYSTASYTGAQIPVPGANAIVGVSTATSNSNWNIQENPANLKMRLVASGLRIRNVTPYMYRGGVVRGLETPQHNDAIGYTYSSMSLYDQSGAGDIEGKWSSLVWHPVDEDEFDYVNGRNCPIYTDIVNGNTDNILWNNSLAFCVQSPALQTQQYEFEVVGAYEFVGAMVHGTTPNRSDPLGMSAIQETYSSSASRRPSVLDRALTVASSLYKVGMFVWNMTHPAPPRVPLIRGREPIIMEVD